VASIFVLIFKDNLSTHQAIKKVCSFVFSFLFFIVF